MLFKNYYFSSLFWNTLHKVFNAGVGFISVPLLLGYFGKENYGILSLATACNGYMSLLDLGMNVGTVRYFSLWKSRGQNDMLERVARTNITFYGFVAFINAILLLVIATWGEHWFAINECQFRQLRICLFIIAFFSFFSWSSTTFNQLLIADKQIDYTAKVRIVLTLLKIILLVSVFIFKLSLSQYFFILTMIFSSLFIPFSIQCKKRNLLNSFKPAFYWSDFRVVFSFSLSIFALSMFQMTATQSRPLVLGVFSNIGPSLNTEYRVLEVVPSLLITIGSTFTGIFLPKTSEMVSKGNKEEMRSFSYKWTRLTSVFMCVLCFPFILCSKEILTAYVGVEYSKLSIWLIVWCITVLVQMHTTPANALVLAYGRTKLLVAVTSISCLLSVFINAFLCDLLGVGSAIFSYFLYVVVIIGLYYIYFYKKLLDLSRIKMFMSFFTPSLIATIIALIVDCFTIPIDIIPINNSRVALLILCVVKSIVWLIPFMLLLLVFRLVPVDKLKNNGNLSF